MSTYSSLVVGGRLRASTAIGRARSALFTFLAVFLLETATTLRRDGGGMRTGIEMTCRAICGSQTLLDPITSFALRSMRMQIRYDKGRTGTCDQMPSRSLRQHSGDFVRRFARACGNESRAASATLRKNCRAWRRRWAEDTPILKVLAHMETDHDLAFAQAYRHHRRRRPDLLLAAVPRRPWR